jgi:hypothetical protein
MYRRHRHVRRGGIEKIFGVQTKRTFLNIHDPAVKTGVNCAHGS